MGSMIQKGLFISFEGNDGSGKSTQIKLLKEYLISNNIPVLLTREPGGTRIGEKIRKILLDISHNEMDAVAEMFLYASSRAQHIAEVIKPALEEKKVVLCDRFLDSSLVYQGIARELGIETVLKVNELAIGGIWPDITFLLDIDPERALARREKSSEVDRLESERLDFHKEVYKGYMKLKNMFPDRIVVVDALLPVREVFGQIKGFMQPFLHKNGVV